MLKDARKYVLIVDDEPDIVDILQHYIEKWGFAVYTAKNGEDGLEVLKSKKKIDLIVSDLKMPIMDGNEFLKSTIKMGYQGKFLIMSAYFHDFDLKQIEEMSINADDVLKKPFDKRTLLKSLTRLGFDVIAK